MRYWRICIEFETGEEKVDMVGTVLSTEMVRPRLLDISLFTIRMNEDLFVKGFSNSSITFNLLNHDGIYDNRFKGGEEVWIEVDGRKIYTGNVSLTPGGHPNIFPVTVDTNLLGFDEEVNLKIKASEYPNVPVANEGNFGSIIGGTVSDEDEDTPVGVIPCYKVDTGKYLLAWHPCFNVLGAYLSDGTDLVGLYTLSNAEDDRAYVLYTDTDPDMIWVNAEGMVSPKVLFTKFADADVDLTVVLSLHADRELTIFWGDGDSDVVTGPVVGQSYPHTYPDANEYDVEIVGDVRHISYLTIRSEPISGDLEGFEYLGEDLAIFKIDRTSIDGNLSTISNLINLEELYIYATSIIGNISSLRNMTRLKKIYFYSLPIIGTISNFVNMIDMTHLYGYSTSIAGSIGFLAGMTSMIDLRLSDTSVTGVVSTLSGMTVLQILYLNSTNVSGDISGLSSITSLTIISLESTTVSGDLGDLSALVSLQFLSLNGTTVTYNTTTLPTAWDNCTIEARSCGWIVVPVNNFLIDMDTASVASTESIDISGTNSAPIGPGITAKNSLIAKGWTVTTS